MAVKPHEDLGLPGLMPDPDCQAGGTVSVALFTHILTYKTLNAVARQRGALYDKSSNYEKSYVENQYSLLC